MRTDTLLPARLLSESGGSVIMIKTSKNIIFLVSLFCFTLKD